LSASRAGEKSVGSARSKIRKRQRAEKINGKRISGKNATEKRVPRKKYALFISRVSG